MRRAETRQGAEGEESNQEVDRGGVDGMDGACARTGTAHVLMGADSNACRPTTSCVLTRAHSP